MAFLPTMSLEKFMNGSNPPSEPVNAEYTHEIRWPWPAHLVSIVNE